jgi:hypothetical protein
MDYNDETLLHAWELETRLALRDIQKHAYDLGYSRGLANAHSGGRDTDLEEAVLNACISYVIHGDADFSGMHAGLVDYFKKNVKSRLKKPQ